MSIPPRPARFHPEVPPPGFELNLVSFWRERPIITPRLQLFHTNGASGEGSVESSKNWAERGDGNTIPHLQIDRTHGAPRGALLLPSNRKGIANYRAAYFSLGFETADTGTNDDPTISAFDDGQLELCAIAAAYYHVLHGIPLRYPDAWDGAGTASHTEPFGYPNWTKHDGKICPGDKKKAQVRDVVLPRAREIAAAWTGKPKPDPTPEPPTTENDNMLRIIEVDGQDSTFLWDGTSKLISRNPDDRKMWERALERAGLPIEPLVLKPHRLHATGPVRNLTAAQRLVLNRFGKRRTK